MIILIILIIVLLLSLSLINKTLKKKDNILENVKLQENIIKNDGFALMLQKEDGTYQESTSSSWPTDMIFNSELSGCIDTDGKKIENSLSFDSTTNFITLKTNKTSYCYVYFDIDNSATSYLIKNVSSNVLWKSTLEDDGYRYVGTNPDNYICFGTSDKDTCINDTDKYMYRIIGIFSDENETQHVKLIKKEALNKAYAWNGYSINIDWNNSDLYKGLNGISGGEYTNLFINSEDYPYMKENSIWYNKIAIWNYTMTNTKSYENYSTNSVYGPTYDDTMVKTIYLHELNKNEKSNETCYWSANIIADCNVGEWKYFDGKISLMYFSDYALSLGFAALDYKTGQNFSTMRTGWVFLLNNDDEFPEDFNVFNNYEWVMTKYGLGTEYAAWGIDTYGEASTWSLHKKNVVRPVFYLESNVEILDGTGTITDPYLIAE